MLGLVPRHSRRCRTVRIHSDPYLPQALSHLLFLRLPLGVPRRLRPGSAKFMNLWTTFFSSLFLRMISSIGGRFSSRLYVLIPYVLQPRYSKDLTKHPHLCGGNCPRVISVHFNIHSHMLGRVTLSISVLGASSYRIGPWSVSASLTMTHAFLGPPLCRLFHLY